MTAERRIRALVLLLGMLAPVLGSCGGDDTSGIQASGTVEATDADLGFQMAGRIDSVKVHEGDSVRRAGGSRARPE